LLHYFPATFKLLNLDKKNLNSLSRKAITTELQQLTNYLTFILLDSVNDKENIYSGVAPMDTLRIGFS
jgi:hypothetical protein